MTAQHVQPTLTGTELLAPGRNGVVRVLGGSGTGKSSLLISTAVEHIAAGTDPESVLLLTGSARLRSEARAAITARLLGAGTHGVVREPLVRTVHSYAFALLRLAAQRNGDPPPRLITTAEQDGIIRELLAGDLEDGADSPVGWPEQLWPALSTAGFATELRDLLARCTERGVDPRALQRLGRSAGRPEWLAAGRFAQAYEQIMLLRSAVGMAAPQATVPALGAAELVDGADPRYTLWQVWNACRLQPRWLAASERGGTIGVQADRDLDAVTALFDVADQYVNRTAGASLRGLVDHVTTLGASMSTADADPQADAVAVLSAHAALGREWDFVVIAGVQEGLWPNTVPRGGILGTQNLVDVLDGVAAPDDRSVSTRAPLLAEERRLLMAAMGRARTRLLVTAVDSDGGDESLLPSPFCAELAEVATESVPLPPLAAPRVLQPSAVVGRLRAVVCAPEGAVDEESRSCAATQLARLAAAGVPGADPSQWHTMTPLSTEEPLWSDPEHVVTLSPSTLQMLTDCPLRWLLERHGGSDGRDVRSTVGSLLHALVSDSGKTESQLVNDLEKVWEDLPFEAKWYSDNELTRHRAMLETFTRWRADSRGQLTEVATEIDVEGTIVEPGPEGPGVRVRGRLDRLERDRADRLVVVDLKTGKSPVTKDDAQKHAQLATYQLAVAAGLLPHGDEPGGGRLVYLGKAGAAGATEREQDPMTPDTRADWLGTVGTAAAATAGPQFTARVNDGCANCPVRSSCPAQALGDRS
nr:UrvD/REP family ATP-dependent DNA helicase [Mycolicibacterium boenickei]